jgi:membrane protease YdiL (CAAX protease family)
MWRDARFWAAMLAAPLYWSVMWLVNRDAVQLHWPQASRALLLVVFAYPVLEEIVFRGLLHEYLRRHLPWRLPGPVCGELMFRRQRVVGKAHGNEISTGIV